MLDALKSLQQAEVEQAKQPLPGHVSAKKSCYLMRQIHQPLVLCKHS